MKKLIVILLLFIACQPSPRTYVNHTEGPYSIADDTLILQNEFIISRCGYQKIRNGKRLLKQYRVREWKRDILDAPVVRVDGRHAYGNNTIYRQIPSITSSHKSKTNYRCHC